MNELGRFISRKELGLIFWGGPIAIILMTKTLLDVEKIHRIGDYFICHTGIFGIDSDAVYRHGKQPLILVNSHGHYMPKELVKKFYHLYYKKKFITMKKELEKFYPSIKTQKFSSIYEVLKYIVDLTDHNSINLNTEKYLPYYRAYNPVAKKRTNEFAWKGIEAIKSLNPQFKKALPLVAVMIAVVIFVVIWKDIPGYVEQLQGALAGIGR